MAPPNPTILYKNYNIFYILDATVSNSVHVLGIQPIHRNKKNVFQEYLSKNKIFLSCILIVQNTEKIKAYLLFRYK